MTQNESTDQDRVPIIMHRRGLLKGSAVAASGALALGLAPTQGLASGGVQKMPAWMAALIQPEAVDDLDAYVPKALTDGELTTLKAAIDRLIPSDDSGPGAVDAGVFVYIDRSLNRPYADKLSVYQEGLAALDTAAGSGGFAAATPEQQDEILTQAEAGELEGAPEGFFNLLLAHTQEGMFSDPIYGGNRDFAGWDLLGYPGIRLVWSVEDQAFNAEIEPEHRSVAEFGGSPL